MELLAAPYPITPSPLGFFRSVGAESGIKGDLIQLILTNPGERVMMPEYGTPLRELMFEQNTDALKQIASDMILKSISLWEPRILVNELVISTAADREENKSDFLPFDSREKKEYQYGANEYVMLIKLKFSLFSNLKNIVYLVIAVPIGESNV
jgi:phage baseplate assembly protein W